MGLRYRHPFIDEAPKPLHEPEADTSACYIIVEAEYVTLEEIHGDLSDLVGSPILQAEQVSSKGDDYQVEEWSFYKLATIKGSVTLRWYGTSNGYYSTDVDFTKGVKT